VDPVGTIKRISEGTFTAEHGEALAAVYPKFLGQARDLLVEALAIADQEGRKVPMPDRVQIGVALGTTLQPGFLAALQAAHGSQNPEDPAGTPAGGASGGAVLAGGASKMDPTSAMTASQRVEAGIARA
jgi:hypothetical protein